jgi:Big-like domain-containing protein
MRAITRNLLGMLLLSVAVAVFACSPEQIASVARVVRIVLGANTATIAVGSHVTLQAVPTDSAGYAVPNASVAWTSSRATVAAVSPQGEVTGVAPGTATVTAASGDQTADIAVTVTNVVVASVGVAPTSVSLAAGQTTQLRATPRDGSGAALTGRIVTWTSANTAVAAVSSSGVVSGVAAGQVVVTATSEGVSGQATITVTAVPPSNGSWPNEPAGYRVLTDQPWNALSSLGWQHVNRTSQSRVVQDPTAPFSPTGVLEDIFPNGFVGGNDPADDWFAFSGTQEIYVGFWYKHNPNFQSHPTGNKLAFIWSWTAPGRDFIIGVEPPPGWPFLLVSEGFGTAQDPGAHRFYANVGNGQALPGVWHRIEIYVKNSSPLGTGNGILRFWLDGQLVGNYTNVLMPVGTSWDQFELTPTWGGLGSVKSQDDYVRYDHVHVSRP